MKPSLFTIAPPQLELRTLAPASFAEVAADKKRDTLEAMRFERETVTGIVRTGLALHGCLFDHVRFVDCRLPMAQLFDVRFVHCDLSLLDLWSAGLNRVEFIACKLQGANLSEAMLRNLLVSETAARFLNLVRARFNSVRFSRSDFRSSLFSDGRQTEMSVEACDFTECDFSRFRSNGVDWRDSTLDGISAGFADFRGARVTVWQAAELARLAGLIVED